MDKFWVNMVNRHPQEKISLGVMVVYRRSIRTFPPFSDRGFYRRLSKFAEARGMEVLIFDPIFVDWNGKTVGGYQYRSETGKWHKVRRAIPPIIYDRCFYSGRSQFIRYSNAINRLRRIPSVRFLMRGLSGKWQVQQALALHPTLRKHLPETSVLTDLDQVFEWLEYKTSCILKPNGGSHGKKIVRVRKMPDGRCEVTGRDSANQPVHAVFDTRHHLRRWLREFIGTRKYLIQEYLSLHTADGRSFDVRSLVQKGGDGRWHITGMAARVGQPGSLTANIHGGGTGAPLLPFLQEHYEVMEVDDIMRRLQELSSLIPRHIERNIGQLVELGIDFGVDQSGRVWILEVNSKPGRSIFAQLQDVRRSRASVCNLLDYARYLFDRQLGG